MDSELNFGSFSVGCKEVSKHLPVTNHGSESVIFEVLYAGDPTVKFSPLKGVIGAGCTRWIKVELQTGEPKRIHEEAVVKLENHSDFVLSIKAEVIQPNLQISDKRGKPVTCMWLKPMYFGTSCVESFLLTNNSEESCEWFCRLMITTAGTEVACELQKSSSSALLEDLQRFNQSDNNIYEEFHLTPKQGILEPYEKTKLTMCFNPVFKPPYRYKDRPYSSGQRDYCIFLRFESLRMDPETLIYTESTGVVELAVTLSALPVTLVPSPSEKFEFDCVLGKSKAVPCILQNLCSQLPINFRFRKLAHFIVTPAAGTIPAGQNKEVEVKFTARQQGKFQIQQIIDVMGYMFCRTSDMDVPIVDLKAFDSICLNLSAVCNSEVTLPVISRSVNNPTGLRPDVRAKDLSACRDVVQVAVLNAHKTNLHRHAKKDSKQAVLVAFPNDRASSIRPGSSDKDYQTIFTGIRRYNYLDTEYALTEEEVEQRDRNHQKFRDFINRLRVSRQKKSQRGQAERSEVVEDIETVLYNGLTPPKLGIKDLQSTKTSLYYLLLKQTVEHSRSLYNANFDPEEEELEVEEDHSVPAMSTCIINKHRPYPLVVQADVVHGSLELSTTLLQLRPTSNLLAASGYRSSVTLRNHNSQPAEFTWKPVVTDPGLLFTIRPAKGIVGPHRELNCEVVWHPSFNSHNEGMFDLCVAKGKTQRLHCTAKVGSSDVQLGDYRVIFGSVPLNMLSTRTAVIYNNGQNHAYFKVLDDKPLPGMTVSPTSGVVPAAGQTHLKIEFQPDSVIKFDTTIDISFRNMKPLELRIGGSVEPPDVDISVMDFHFDAHVGSRKKLFFSLKNNSPAAAFINWRLSEYMDFSLHFPSAKNKTPDLSRSQVEVDGHQTICGMLVFTPTQAASYEFYLPLFVNGIKWPSSFLQHTPIEETPIENGELYSALYSHPSSLPMKLTALVLNPPLKIFPSKLHFHVASHSSQEPKLYTQEVLLIASQSDNVCWDVIGDEVKWWIHSKILTEPKIVQDCEEPCVVSQSSGVLRRGESSIFVVSIKPNVIVSNRLKRLTIFLYLGEKGSIEEQPYRDLSIEIALQLPSITISPPQLQFDAIPPGTSAFAELSLLASGYGDGTTLSAEVEDHMLEDGTRVQPVSVNFLEGNTIPPSQQASPPGSPSQSCLKCQVVFSSSVSQSICVTITFTDHLNNSFKVKVCATSDNCLLTLWPFLAEHRRKQEILFIDGPVNVEANIQVPQSPGYGPSHYSSADIDRFPSPGVIPFPEDPAQVSEEDAAQAEIPVDPSRPQFPKGSFSQNVVLALERWFGFFGCPGGPQPISIPHTLRRVVLKAQIQDLGVRNYPVRQNKETRSVVDIINHLVGQLIPGVPHWPTFSKDTKQLTQQLLKQHKTTIEFLKVQGASLSHIRPEYLLDEEEFKYWWSLQSYAEDGLDYDKNLYESLSKRSWTDLMIQIFKVLVLHRVAKNKETTIEDIGLIGVTPKPLISNVYTPHELKLLSWLNLTYKSVREMVWPPENTPWLRWIVSFDRDLADGLVIASVIAAYCPYMIKSHFQRMYTDPENQEQVLHNNIIVVQALKILHLNMDIQATELSDPNPIQMLILCFHLYERLPQYVPQKTIRLSGALHSSLTKQVDLTNPSRKTIKYKAKLLGEDAKLFSLPDGCDVSIPPGGRASMAVQFIQSFLQPKEAVLVMLSTSTTGATAATLVCNLITCVTSVTPSNILTHESSCYAMNVIHLPVVNHLKKESMFKVLLVESTFNPLEPDAIKDEQRASSNNAASAQSREQECQDDCDYPGGDDSEFISSVRCLFMRSTREETIPIYFLPFSPGIKYCSVLLLCPQVGDMVFLIKATVNLPAPSYIPLRHGSNRLSSNDITVLHLHCKAGEICEDILSVPYVNLEWEHALSMWGQLQMSSEEYQRRMLTHTLHSSSLRASTALCKLHKHEGTMKYFAISKEIVYDVEVSSPKYFTFPKKVVIPVKEDTKVIWDKNQDRGCTEVPIKFKADAVGHYTCQVVLRSWCDTRVYLVNALATAVTPRGQ